MEHEILGSEWFPRTDAERDALYERFVVGTRSTNWGILAKAARSTLGWSIKASADLLNLWSRLRHRGQDAAETWFLVTFNYDLQVLGPLLGTIANTVFALESFVRFSAELHVEWDRSNEREADAELRKFDRLSFRKRVHAVASFWEAGDLPGDLNQRVDALIQFRNRLAHDSPVGFLSGGLTWMRRHGKRQIHLPEVSYGAYYPTLYDHNMPLAPRHAMLAARTHDDFVEHVRGDQTSMLASKMRTVASRALEPVSVPIGFRGDIDEIIDGWDSHLMPWVDSVSADDKERLYRDIVRRAKIERSK